MSVLPLHAVPPLLRFIVARNGNLETDEHGGCVSNLKQLRLVCKYFNEVVTSAAKGYCLQLSDHPSSFDNVEEHWRVAELLRYAKLDRLRVFIVVGPGKEAQLQSSHDRDIHACTGMQAFEITELCSRLLTFESDFSCTIFIMFLRKLDVGRHHSGSSIHFQADTAAVCWFLHVQF